MCALNSPLSMEAFLKVVRPLPVPTEKQVGNFVEYVCSAHSWYKHIPLVPPGVAFHLFINPNVACEISLVSPGQVEYRERRVQGIHYAEWPTEKYRQECGYLDYHCSRSTVPMVLLLEKESSLDEVRARVEEERAKRELPLPVPDEIMRAGQVYLTGVIHEWASQPNIWLLRSERPGFVESNWPAETGGRDTLTRILETCKRQHLSNTKYKESSRLELDRLINPERERQKAVMRATVERVLQLVYG